jgi:hypothetical protein
MTTSRFEHEPGPVVFGNGFAGRGKCPLCAAHDETDELDECHIKLRRELDATLAKLSAEEAAHKVDVDGLEADLTELEKSRVQLFAEAEEARRELAACREEGSR